MKIRTLLIIGLFVLAFAPLLLFMSLNMPRVLTQFKTAEETRQLLLIKGSAKEIAMTLKWNLDSLKALSFNSGVIELASNRSFDFPVELTKKRVGAMLSRWYLDNPEVLNIRFFDRQGIERFAIGMKSEKELFPLPDGQHTRPCPSSLLPLANLHANGTVYNAGFEVSVDTEGKQHPVMHLGAALQSKGSVVGAVCLSFDLSPLLQQYAGYLVQYDEKMHQFTPLFASAAPVVDFMFQHGMYPVEPVLAHDRNDPLLTLALVPFFIDAHLSENVFLVYPVEIGSTMVWVGKWRKQVLALFGLVLLAVCLIALKLSKVIDRFSKELLTSFHSLLHTQQSVDFSWSGIEEIKRLSRDLNTLSLHYQENLRSQELMKQETREMERELRQSQKMKALGLLAGGVAHDLNNILSGIISYPQLLLLQLPRDSELRTPILEIQHSGERAAAVVADLLTVARGVAGKMECHDLNILIQEYLESPECSALKKHHPKVSCNSRLLREELPVLCSPVHITKALMNLVTNAIESIVEEGQITVSTRLEQQVAKDLTDSKLLPGEYAILEVKDTGPGISDKDLEHIFEPFYSKKTMGRSGTGLGLTVVWNTITDHDGRVKVTSSTEGTCFELFFPLYHGRKSKHRGTLPEQEDLQGHGEQILVIDDEAQQRDLASKILGVYGYRVHTAASGEEAVKFLKTQESDLLLLDMIMDPGINGYETYRQILKTRPNQKAIIVSGYSESQEVKKAKELGILDFVKKPYSMDILARAVKDALSDKEKI